MTEYKPKPLGDLDESDIVRMAWKRKDGGNADYWHGAFGQDELKITSGDINTPMTEASKEREKEAWDKKISEAEKKGKAYRESEINKVKDW